MKKVLLFILLISVLVTISFTIYSPTNADSSVSIEVDSDTSSITKAGSVSEVVVPIQNLTITTNNIKSTDEPLNVTVRVTNLRTNNKIIDNYRYDISKRETFTISKAINAENFSSEGFPKDKTTDIKVSVTADHPDVSPTVSSTQFTVNRVVDRSSCKSILESDPNADSGVYTLESNSGSFKAYCDMEYDGGGWTAVMSLDDDHNKFTYSNNYWENKSTYKSGDSNPFDLVTGSSLLDWRQDGTDVDGPRKYKSYSAVNGSEMRAEFGNPSHSVTYQRNLTQESVYDVFTDGEDRTFSHRNTCARSVSGNHPDFDGNIMVLGNGAQASGVNIVDTGFSYGDGKYRFGFGSDEDDTHGVGSLGLGIGTGSNSVAFMSGGTDGGDCGYSGDTSQSTSRDTSAILWIR